MRNTHGALMVVMLFVGAVLLLAAPAWAQSSTASPALPGLPSYKTLEARYPGSDGVVLFDSLVITLDKDNHIAKRRHRAVMLFTDNAINRYGDPRILFNAATQELSVITARVYMRDGTIVDTRKNGINQTTPFALDHAPDYTDWQETVVTHVGIEKGCVAELRYVIRDKAPSPWLSGVEIFSSEDPVQVRVLEIRGPGASNLKSASLNGAPAAEKTADGISRWTVRDIAGRTPFDGGAWEGDCFPVVCYSTAAGWPDVLSKIRAGIIEKSRNASYFASIVGEATKDLPNGDDKELAIQRLALDHVSSVRAPFGLFAAPPRDAQRIYESGYASPLDRAVLLMAMFEAAGLNPVPVLVSAGSSWVDEAAAPEIFNTVFVGPGPRGRLLDPGVAYEHDPTLGIMGRTLVHLDGRYPDDYLDAWRSLKSASRLDLVLKPGADGSIAGSGTALLTLLFSPYYLTKGAGSEVGDFVKARVCALFGGAELTSWNPHFFDQNAVEIAFAFTVKLPEKKPGERVYLTVPRPFEAALSGIDHVRVERSLSADGTATMPCQLDVSCTIEPPTGWKIIALPAESDARNEFGSAAVSVKSTLDGAKICTRTLVFDSALVRPADYAKLRSLLLAFGEDRLVLERE